MKAITVAISFCILFQISFALLPPKFQWKYIDYSWQDNDRSIALQRGFYIPESNLPTGIARWKDKLFITVPRWKMGVVASLNYINVNGPENQTLTPYPSWSDAFVRDTSYCVTSNSTVISAFKATVDKCDRLWVVDNGVSDMATFNADPDKIITEVAAMLGVSIWSVLQSDGRHAYLYTTVQDTARQIVDPAIVIFNLNNDELINRYIFPSHVLKENSVLSSVEVDCEGPCEETYAYVTDMGANAIIVYDLNRNVSWRIEHEYFRFDPQAGLYRVGGIDFYWSDGVSSAALGPKNQKTGQRDLYFQPTSSTKLFKMSTELLNRNNASRDELNKGIQIVGDRGPNSQVTSTVYDGGVDVLFYTLLSQNGVGCWHLKKPFEKKNTPVVIQDCSVLEFPNDIKIDSEGNIWMLSDRQSRFLYNTMNFNDVNFRVLTAPSSSLVEGTACGGGVKKVKSIRKIMEKKRCQ